MRQRSLMTPEAYSDDSTESGWGERGSAEGGTGLFAEGAPRTGG
jgi:hypothetical protein